MRETTMSERGLSSWAMRGAFIWAIAAALAGYAVTKEKGLWLCPSFFFAIFLLISILDWRKGIYGLLAYLPFAGIVIMAFDSSRFPLLAKDIFFVIPAYIAFFGLLVARNEKAIEGLWGFPRFLIFLLGVMCLLVLIQALNPNVTNKMVALIGIKVWLFYVPLIVLGYAFIDDRLRVIHLMRFMLVLAFVPCIVGIMEQILAQIVGFRELMTIIYGDAAYQATQRFTVTNLGGGSYGRIPSTFVFVTQYISFTLAMIVPAYVVMQADRSRFWRVWGAIGLALITMASFLSGARASFILVPLLFLLLFMIDRRFGGLARAACAILGIFFSALYFLGASGKGVYEIVSLLFVYYAHTIAYGGLIQAFHAGLLGMGTGTNTIAARYAARNPMPFLGIENFYGKLIYELGILGLMLFIWILLWLIIAGMGIVKRVSDPLLRSFSAGLLAYIIFIGLVSFKGALLDHDPANVYFWFFSGMLLKLPLLERKVG